MQLNWIVSISSNAGNGIVVNDGGLGTQEDAVDARNNGEGGKKLGSLFDDRSEGRMKTMG